MKLKMDSSYTIISQRLSKLTTPLICDALGSVRLMDPEIHSMGDEEQQCIGRAYPINSAQDSLSTMEALDDLSNFINFLDCKNDLVPILLVIASMNTDNALVGGMCTKTAKIKGFGGIITDGNCRDLKEIKDCNLSVFARGRRAKSGSKDKIGTIKESIECGNVKINSGDLVFADIDGIVVMDKEEAINAINKAEEILEKESRAMEKIKDGSRIDEVCNLKEHMQNLRDGVPSSFRLTI